MFRRDFSLYVKGEFPGQYSGIRQKCMVFTYSLCTGSPAIIKFPSATILSTFSIIEINYPKNIVSKDDSSQKFYSTGFHTFTTDFLKLCLSNRNQILSIVGVIWTGWSIFVIYYVQGIEYSVQE